MKVFLNLFDNVNLFIPSSIISFKIHVLLTTQLTDLFRPVRSNWKLRFRGFELSGLYCTYI